MPLTSPAMREQFPIARRYAYLDHAAIAPMAVPVQRAIADYMERQQNEPFEEKGWAALRADVRSRIAELLGTTPEHITFTRNTTAGLSLVAAGLSFRPGENVVCVQGEFPANVYPWMGLKRKGVELRFYEPTDGRIDVGGLLKMCDSRTRVVAISWVQFANGFRSDLVSLGSELRSRETFLVVDAMQAVGHLATDLGRLPVDLLAAAAPKWMLGPLGIGFAYVSERLFPRLWPPSIGVESVVQDHEYFRYELCLKPDARRFEDSGPNLAGLSGLNAAVDLLLQAGPAQIEARVLQLADSLREDLRRRGHRLLLEPAPRERSGIVSFRHRSEPAATVAARLREAGVITSLRGDFVRASPHFYNNEDDLGRLLEALPA